MDDGDFENCCGDQVDDKAAGGLGNHDEAEAAAGSEALQLVGSKNHEQHPRRDLNFHQDSMQIKGTLYSTPELERSEIDLSIWLTLSRVNFLHSTTQMIIGT